MLVLKGKEKAGFRSGKEGGVPAQIALLHRPCSAGHILITSHTPRETCITHTLRPRMAAC